MKWGRPFSVSQINQYIKGLLEDDVLLSGVFVEGELSNVKRHSSGHVYFSLRDEHAALACVMFKNAAETLSFAPENGLHVLALGRVSVYPKTGQYQLYVDALEPVGAGAAYLAFEQLKRKLDAEGLFRDDRKRPLPPYPRCVAVISSPTGAVVHDIMQIARRRNPLVQIVVIPAQVQGADAPESICQALSLLNRWGGADVAILARGGGSMEDLQPFNDEAVAHAVAASCVPVISAVGHETDFTIADFVADLRAPTPSAAAEIAFPLLAELRGAAAYQRQALTTAMEALLRRSREALRAAVAAPVFTNPLLGIYQRQLYVTELRGKMQSAVGRRLEKARWIFTAGLARLEGASPVAALRKGYALVYNDAGGMVSRASQLSPGQRARLVLWGGEARVTVDEVRPGAIGGETLGAKTET